MPKFAYSGKQKEGTRGFYFIRTVELIHWTLYSVRATADTSVGIGQYQMLDVAIRCCGKPVNFFHNKTTDFRGMPLLSFVSIIGGWIIIYGYICQTWLMISLTIWICRYKCLFRKLFSLHLDHMELRDPPAIYVLIVSVGIFYSRIWHGIPVSFLTMAQGVCSCQQIRNGLLLTSNWFWL